MQWRIVGKDGIIVEVMEVVGVEGSRVLFERFMPLHDTVLKRYRVASPYQEVELALSGCVLRCACPSSAADRNPVGLPCSSR